MQDIDLPFLLSGNRKFIPYINANPKFLKTPNELYLTHKMNQELNKNFYLLLFPVHEFRELTKCRLRTC